MYYYVICWQRSTPVALEILSVTYPMFDLGAARYPPVSAVVDIYTDSEILEY